MLVACDRCKRHISIREEHCPFCKQRSAITRIGAAALSAGVMLSGCDAGKDKTANHTAVENKPYATVRGTAKDGEGKALAGATVIIGNSDTATGRSYEKRTRTDASGRFAFDLLEPGPCALYVQYNSYEAGQNLVGQENRQLPLKAGDDLSLDIKVDVRDMGTAMPYGAPPARRRVV